ncbi:helix-turn-helix transcriptional regulator [Christensenella minuta]|uniref:helix-turn-helix domain-containing protein n=1 Tax=Christensenella minuta TaxID=626937 RepID=UPI002A82F441|nr:helix-turn-helix transcriptional regulator [Christensenella minuta]MDY3750533.1 helix-turn-helix transcriptional regulator [Christensenella minuta]
MNLFEKVKQLCESKNITIAKLEREMGFGNGTIKNWGNATPSGDRLAKVADYFYVTVDYLLDREPKETDDEMTQLLQEIKDDPDKRMLFSLTKKATTEDVKVMVKFLEGITKSDGDE